MRKFNTNLLKEEPLALGSFHPNPEVFINPNPKQWLEHFISQKSHQTFGYKTPQLK